MRHDGLFGPAAALNERVFERPAEGTVYQMLRELWCRDLGLDYTAQATKLALV